MSSSHDDVTRALIASDPSFAKDVDAAHAMASIGYGITRLCECGLTGDEMVDSITYVLDLADCDFEQRITTPRSCRVRRPARKMLPPSNCLGACRQGNQPERTSATRQTEMQQAMSEQQKRTLLPDHGPNPYPGGTLAGDMWELNRAWRHFVRVVCRAVAADRAVVAIGKLIGRRR